MTWHTEGGEKLGIIGGMGSWATSYFFELLVNKTRADKDQDHIDTIILNHASMPDRTKTILGTAEDQAHFVQLLLDDISQLQQLGVTSIAIPCNTSHYFLRQLAHYTDLPVVDMIDETVNELTKTAEPGAKIGILATDGTVKTQLYSAALLDAGFEPIVPEVAAQADLMEIIYGQIKQGLSGDIDLFLRIGESLRSAGCQMIIIGCTELSYFNEKLDSQLPDYYIDALDVLACSAIRSVGKEVIPQV